ncbi:MAG: hypothetical protein L6R42_004641 [Xanthoria sp. 1 TBL-2021]|nr:MAG: hypothetical protein L6R42_004641 [Xanthoria sp. 1 TBL-2021]
MADPLAPIHRLSPAEQLYQLHHIDDDRRPAGISGLVIPCILAYIAVVLRVYSRKVSDASLQADDHLIVISLVEEDMSSFLGTPLLLQRYVYCQLTTTASGNSATPLRAQRRTMK